MKYAEFSHYCMLNYFGNAHVLYKCKLLAFIVLKMKDLQRKYRKLLHFCYILNNLKIKSHHYIAKHLFCFWGGGKKKPANKKIFFT